MAAHCCSLALCLAGMFSGLFRRSIEEARRPSSLVLQMFTELSSEQSDWWNVLVLGPDTSHQHFDEEDGNALLSHRKLVQ